MSLIWYAITGLILLLVQINIGYIAVESIAPDLLLILVVFVALREGQFLGIIAGFLIGLLFDLLASGTTGTNALAKLMAGFVAGFFHDETFSLQESVGTFRFLWIVALAAFIHNIILTFFFVQPSELTFVGFFLRRGVAAALYTTVLASLVMLAAARKQRD